MIRVVVERSVANGHADLAGIGRHHPFHERIEAAARFARRIEEFDDVDLCLGRSGGGRIVADEVRLAREHLRRVGLLALIDQRTDDERRQEHDGG